MQEKRCAFLTMNDTSGWAIDADLAIAPMKSLGWTVEWVRWRSESPDWNRFDAVYVCTPWDYPQDPKKFLALLSAIDESNALLVNDLELLLWSLSKTYLRDLESRGAGIVPSLWPVSFSANDVGGYFDALDAERIIIKPVVSTNATNTFLLDRDVGTDTVAQLERIFTERDFLVQPFMTRIQAEGEYSLFYMSGSFSHAIRKTPKASDFRVQEEYGACIEAHVPEQKVLATANHVMSLVEPTPMYARCDLVRSADDRYLVMELELIEPSMYLRTDAGAPSRFAKAFDDHVRVKKSALA